MLFNRFFKSPLFDAAGSDGSQAGGGGTAQFDPAAFKTELLGEFTKMFNGGLKSLKADFAKMVPVTPAATAGTGAGDGAQGEENPAASGTSSKTVDPAIAAQLRAMERRNNELNAQFTAMKAESDKTRADADAKELASTVRSKLASKFKFFDDAASQDAFDIFAAKVKRDEEGNFVGHDGTPIDQYLEEGMRAKSYLLAPKEVGGAGARTGRGPGGKAPIDIESIKPGMKAEDLAAVRAEIARVAAEAMSGR